jgi:ABC-2 type transport system ATP-binding protein
MSDAIRTDRLGKEYPGGTVALKDVSLNVRRGEIFGFLGPNGAGKTTTISILTTVLRPTWGYAEVEGVDVALYPERIRRTIGLVFQRSTADETLTGRENLEIAAGLYGLAPSVSRSRIREVLEELDLTSAADRPVRGYSGGMRRRLEIAAGIVHEPRILFLDEPTLGLDPQGRAQFWQYIRSLRGRREMTIFLTTHYLEEADQLSDRIAIIDRGGIVAVGSPTSLKADLGGDQVDVRTPRASPDAAAILARVPGVVKVHPLGNNGAYRLSVARSEAIVPSIVRSCDAAGLALSAISTRTPSLDEVFLTITGRQYHENGEGDANGPAARPAGGG